MNIKNLLEEHMVQCLQETLTGETSQKLIDLATKGLNVKSNGGGTKWDLLRPKQRANCINGICFL